MKGLFSYDSPLGQVLNFLGDLFLVNIVFLICCIPVITIGPAQSGLYNAMRVLQDREDESSAIKAYFRGFKNGFFSISFVWTLFLVFDLVLFYTTAMCLDYAETGIFMHWAIPATGLLLSLILHANVTIFHSRFQCTVGQLIRNAFLMLISHPLCSLAVAALTWAPLIIYCWDINLFVNITPVFITVYYSIAFMFGVIAMKKPFKQLIEKLFPEDEEEETPEEKAEETTEE